MSLRYFVQLNKPGFNKKYSSNSIWSKQSDKITIEKIDTSKKNRCESKILYLSNTGTTQYVFNN